MGVGGLTIYDRIGVCTQLCDISLSSVLRLDKVDLAGSGDSTSVCDAGGGGSQILAVHYVPQVLLHCIEGIHAGYCLHADG